MPVPDTLQLPLERIQGNVLRGYGYPFAVHQFVHFTTTAARAWLDAIRNRVTTAEVWPAGTKPPTTLNVAFTAQGLRLLGVKEEDLETFPAEFRAGMAARAALLGDTGPSAPTHWDVGAPGGPPLHALVSAHALSQPGREAELAWLRSLLGPDVRESAVQPVALLPSGKEHFGFRDGIAQPALQGAGLDIFPGHGTPHPLGWTSLAAGEFLLGWPDETGILPPQPSPAELSRNGTFLVWRKQHQHVFAFRSTLGAAAQEWWGTAGAERLDWLRARLVGRWPSGCPVALSPDADDPTLAADWERNNDFRFASDPVGFRCPRGAHVRRANPRDALDGQDVAVNRHRMLRRGMPYGPELPEGTADDGQDRGLIFVALVAGIARQFEFVQRQWMQRGDFAGLSTDERDPLVANNGPGSGGSFLIPDPQSPRILFDLPRFVTVRGGGYFFLPSIDALRLLAGAG